MRPIRCTAALIVLLNVSVARADKIMLVAGGGAAGEGPATEAKLTGPFGVDSDRDGNIYIVEHSGQQVRRVDSKGMLTTIAGTGEKGSGGDGGPALQAKFNDPHSLALGRDGSLHV